MPSALGADMEPVNPATPAFESKQQQQRAQEHSDTHTYDVRVLDTDTLRARMSLSHRLSNLISALTPSLRNS